MSATAGARKGGRRKGSARVQPLVQESTSSMIAHRLREAIATGAIPPGSRLTETELASQLQVSRGPLREGMQRLAQEGLVVSIRNRGLFVIEMTPENVRDMYLAREAVERAAALCLVRQDEAAREESAVALLDVLAEMDSAATASDGAGMGAADVKFHRLLVELSESPRLARIHDTLMAETQMCIDALQTLYASHHERVAEHRAIAEAIRRGDAEETDRRVIDHMSDAIARLAPPADPIAG